ncbi:hypothetical protein [Nocardia salmonicida]|uniref:hypothetical protein n=1 Tax=Nocardia salmonicida TaxID=53431 RepID=UPI0033CCCFC9
MRPGTIVILALVVILLGDVALRALLHREAATGASQAPPADVFGYHTAREFVIVRDDVVVARVPGAFGRQVWTGSGNTAVLLSLAPAADERWHELTYVDSRTGISGRIPCESCVDIVAHGPDSVVVLVVRTRRNGTVGEAMERGLSQLWRFRFGGPEPIGTVYPGNRTGGPELVAATSTHVLSAGRDLDAIRLEREIPVPKTAWDDRPLEATTLSSYDDTPYASSVAADPGADRLLLAPRTVHPPYCGAADPIEVLTDSLEHRRIYPPAAATAKTGTGVHDLWWSADGGFHATVATWPCREMVGRVTWKAQVSLASWRLEPETGQWFADGPTSATMTRSLPSGIRLLLEIPSCTSEPRFQREYSNCVDGTLYAERRGVRTTIADEVEYVSTPALR